MHHRAASTELPGDKVGWCFDSTRQVPVESDTEEKPPASEARTVSAQWEGSRSRRKSFSLADEPLLELLFSFSVLKYVGCVVSL